MTHKARTGDRMPQPIEHTNVAAGPTVLLAKIILCLLVITWNLRAFATEVVRASHAWTSQVVASNLGLLLLCMC